MVCKRYTRVAWRRTGEADGIVTRLRCKQWECPYCAEANRKMWREFLLNRLPKLGMKWWLITLTANEDTHTAWSSAANIRSHLDALFKRMRRIWPKMQYVRIYELHPTSGRVHAHLVMGGLTPYVLKKATKQGVRRFVACEVRNGRKGTWAIKTWLKITCRELGMGYMADASPPRGNEGDAVGYILKYATKEMQDLHVKSLRHVQTSTGVGSPEKGGDHEWETGLFMPRRAWEKWETVRDVDTKYEITSSYWDEHDFYPFSDDASELPPPTDRKKG